MLEELKSNNEYNGYFDFLKQSGDTEKAINSNIRENVYGYASVIPYTLSAIGDNPNIIKQKYIKLIFENPKVFFNTKWDFTKRCLGIGNYVITDLAFDYNNSNEMYKYGMNDTKKRENFINNYHTYSFIITTQSHEFRYFFP